MSADPSRLPPPHWTEKDGWPRHPQTAAEWDWRQDGPENDPKERSRLRLAFGADLADPRAPDQMALVLRVDLSRVVSELVWRRAQVEMYQSKAPAPTHYGLFRPSVPNSPMIKEAEYFKEQGGLTEEWGKAWEPIAAATSIGDARRKFATKHSVALSSIYDGEDW